MLFVIIGVAFVIALIILNLRKALKKDLKELETNPINMKFKIISDILNRKCFEGKGKLEMIDKRTFTIYEKNNFRAEYFRFEYSSGHLSIYWTVQSNVMNTKKRFEYRNVRSISDSEQTKIGNEISTWVESQINQILPR